MLYVNFSNGKSVEWHIGTKPLKDKVCNICRVESVQADGDELTAVYEQMRGVPLAGARRVVTWRGDFAKFIVDNLR